MDSSVGAANVPPIFDRPEDLFKGAVMGKWKWDWKIIL